MTQTRIDNLTQVTLQLEAGRSADTTDITESAIGYEFIYGLGSGGLTGFEYALADMQCGDSIQLHIHTHEIAKFFEHIQLPD